MKLMSGNTFDFEAKKHPISGGTVKAPPSSPPALINSNGSAERRTHDRWERILSSYLLELSDHNYVRKITTEDHQKHLFENKPIRMGWMNGCNEKMTLARFWRSGE